MPLSFEQKRQLLIQNKFDPDSHDYDESTGEVFLKEPSQPAASQFQGAPVTKPITPFQTGIVTAASSLAPTVAGGIGFAKGIPLGVGLAARLAGAKAGALGGTAVLPGWGTAIGGLLGGLAAGTAASYGASKLQEAVMPDSTKAYLAEAAAQNPKSAMVGNVAPFLLGAGGMAPNVNAGRAALDLGERGLGLLTKGSRTVAPELRALQNQNLMNVGVNAGLMPAISTAQRLAAGEELQSPGELAYELATGAVYSRPNFIGKSKLMGFKDTPKESTPLEEMGLIKQRLIQESTKVDERPMAEREADVALDPFVKQRLLDEQRFAERKAAVNAELKKHQDATLEAQEKLVLADAETQRLNMERAAQQAEEQRNLVQAKALGTKTPEVIESLPPAEKAGFLDATGETLAGEREILKQPAVTETPKISGESLPKFSNESEVPPAEMAAVIADVKANAARLKAAGNNKAFEAYQLWVKNHFPSIKFTEVHQIIDPVTGESKVGSSSGAGDVQIARTGGKDNTGAGFDTLPHETYHEYVARTGGSKDDYAKSLVAKAHKRFGGEEATAQQQTGPGYAKRILDPNYGSLGNRAKDFLAYAKERFNVENEADLRRLLSRELHESKAEPKGYVRPEVAAPELKYSPAQQGELPLGRNQEEFEATEKAIKESGLDQVTKDSLLKVHKTAGLYPKHTDVAGEVGGGTSLAAKIEKKQYSDKAAIDRDFLTATEKELSTNAAKPLGLTPSKRNTVESLQLLNKLRNGNKAEWELLKQAGIENYIKGKEHVELDGLREWLQKNGPQVKVETYGMEGKVSEAKKEYDKMTHEWYDNLKYEVRDSVEKAIREAHRNGTDRNADYNSWINQAIGDGAKHSDIEKYVKLSLQVDGNKIKDTSPRATSAYNTVSALDTTQPMPEWTTTKSGKNVQRVDVVIPNKHPKGMYDRYEQLSSTHDKWTTAEEKEWRTLHDKLGETTEKWQPDNLHENLPNTLGWAMIQYKTGANGEKIAVIAEAQSRWGQEVRKWETTYAESKKKMLAESDRMDNAAIERQAKRDADASVDQYRPGMDTPLDKDYNRLILKAAINQARKEGATHIMVSDAETAMMTEGHDSYSGELHGQGREITPEELAKWEPSQAPGMRLNYDTILPKIASELTGSEGVKVSLGEHKNAMELPTQQWERNMGVEERPSKPRSNLIFKNPDGTPKTDVSGMMYPLDVIGKRLESGEKLTLTGKRYSSTPEIERTFKALAPDPDLPGFKVKASEIAHRFTGEIPGAGPATESLRLTAGKEGALAADSINEILTQTNEKFGKYSNEILPMMRKLSDEDLRRWYAVMIDSDRRHVDLTSELTSPTQRELATKWREIADMTFQEAKEANQPVYDYDKHTGEIKPRVREQNPNYFFQMMSADALDVMQNHKGSVADKKYRKAFVDYQMKEAGITEAEATRMLDNIIGSFSTTGNAAFEKFNAISKAEGYGLPDELIEKNPIVAMKRYLNRFAKARAFYDVVETDPDLLHIFGREYDAWGKSVSPVDASLTSLSGNDKFNRIVELMQGRTFKASPRIDALSSLANNLILGPVTAASDMVTSFGNMSKFVPSVGNLPALWAHMAKGIKIGVEHAKETGRIKDTLRDMTEMLQPQERIADYILGLSDGVARISGRSMLENFSRGLSQSGAEYLIPLHLELAKAGDTKSIKLLKGLANNRDYTKLSVEQLASRLLDIGGQGTYDVRGLPVWMIDSQLAPFFKLAKWNVEQTHNFYKHVLLPAAKGENYTPLFATLIGGTIGGYMAKELREFLNNKRTNIPSLVEIANAPDDAQKLPAAVYNYAAAAAYSGYAGLIGDLAKSTLDIAHKNRPQGFNYPLAELTGDALAHIAAAVDAIKEGEDILKVMPELSKNLFAKNMQVGRLAYNWLGDITKREDTAARRDLRVFKQLSGEELPSQIIPSPDYEDLDAKRFKQTPDLQEAVDLLPSLLTEAIEKAKGSPEKLKQELRKLKANSYQTMPNPDSMPLSFAQYIVYLQKTKGNEEASEVLTNYFQRNAVNKVKTELVPSF